MWLWRSYWFVSSQHSALSDASVALGGAFPEKVVLGMEIRGTHAAHTASSAHTLQDKVAEYVATRINEMREKEAGRYTNIGVIRTNSMKYMPNWLEKGQVVKSENTQ